uniref:DNA polymerase n=1 Tax=Fopius arisanus TaxID=64838 RepID=A0A0C9QIE1_9HYME
MKMEESHKGKQFLGEAEEQLSQSNLQLSPTCNSLKKSHLRFYYLDLLEGVKPGQLYLFGKIYLPLTKIYASCCVTVTIPRRLYLLPISQSSQSMKAVIAEFNKHVMKHGIKKQDYTMQLQRKKYAFDIEDIPTVANYLTVTYPASYPVMLHSDHSQIIKHIFGASLNSLELFLSEREIKGPSWLQIQDSEFVELKKNETRCHYQVSCPSMNNITVVREKLGIPPMVLTELNIKSAPINGVEQVMMIHMSIMKSFNIFEMSTHDQKPTIVDEYCFIRGPVNSLSLPHLTNDGFSFSTATCPSINVVTCNGEKNLLDTFVDKFQCYDPDIIVGYQCENSLENLLNRLQHYNKACPQTKISRIKMDGWNISCNKLRKQSNLRCVIGRPICDVRLAVNEIYPKLATLCNVDLICAELLNTNVGTIKQIASFQVLECYSSIEQIVEFINNTRLESQSIIKLVYHMNIIPLVMEVTAITGHVLSQSFTFPKNMRNEFLLIHAFHKRGYIIPDRRIINVKDKKTFSGGRVLEVIARMHVDTTLLMDFKSLYPNIIREYNICFTTMPGVCFKSFDEIYVQLNAPMGIIPKLVGDIVEARSKAKCHMNTPNISLAEKAKYQAQQLALKLIANTLYGSFGSIYFRFYARNIAAKITAKGREILMNAVTMAKSNTFSTIYGDTDSLIIDTMQRDPTEARRIAGVIKNVVNQQYQFIELELEAIYKYIIIVNRKQYTGLSLIDLPDGKSQLVLEGKGTLPKKREQLSTSYFHCRACHQANV